jgi:hypothetical protein
MFNINDEDQKPFKEDVWSVIYIKNPSEFVQLAAAIQNVYTIRYIKNPSGKIRNEIREYEFWYKPLVLWDETDFSRFNDRLITKENKNV